MIVIGDVVEPDSTAVKVGQVTLILIWDIDVVAL